MIILCIFWYVKIGPIFGLVLVTINSRNWDGGLEGWDQHVQIHFASVHQMQIVVCKNEFLV